jgi:hypothetical protein
MITKDSHLIATKILRQEKNLRDHGGIAGTICVLSPEMSGFHTPYRPARPGREVQGRKAFLHRKCARPRQCPVQADCSAHRGHIPVIDLIWRVGVIDDLYVTVVSGAGAQHAGRLAVGSHDYGPGILGR